MVQGSTNSFPCSSSVVSQTTASESSMASSLLTYRWLCMSSNILINSNWLGRIADHTCKHNILAQGHTKYGCVHHIDWPKIDHEAK